MQKLYLSIPEPCHENWQAMTATDQGRFCHTCAKEVVDFSMMTDTEVLNYFTTVSHEKFCGRTLPSQLERTLRYPKEPKKRLFWYWNYIVMFLMFFSKSNTSKAQAYSKPVTQINPVKSISEQLQGKVGGLILQIENIIEGKIVDENGNPAAFASISITNTKKAVSADAEGKFSIRAINTNNDSLKISASGFETKLIAIKNYKGANIILQKKNEFMGEVVVTGGYGLKRVLLAGGINAAVCEIKKDTIVRKIMDQIRSIVFPRGNTVEVFPNPLKRGSSFALSLKLRQTGIYSIQIADAMGRIVLQKQTSILSKEYMEQVQTDSRWSSGIYYINVSDGQNRSIGKLSFIVK